MIYLTSVNANDCADWKSEEIDRDRERERWLAIILCTTNCIITYFLWTVGKIKATQTNGQCYKAKKTLSLKGNQDIVGWFGSVSPIQMHDKHNHCICAPTFRFRHIILHTNDSLNLPSQHGDTVQCISHIIHVDISLWAEHSNGSTIDGTCHLHQQQCAEMTVS